MKADDVSIVVGLLHDVLEDTLTSKASIAQQFGPEVAELVDGLTKIGKFSYVSREQEQAETFRKMILAMVVGLAGRSRQARGPIAQHADPAVPGGEKRREIARETLDIYAPIANRLGMGTGEGELEDLAFMHLEPHQFARVALDVDRRIKGSQTTIEKIRARLASKLAESGIAGEVTGRVKRYYSIAEKMRRREVDAAELYDILAFRIVTSETRDCYAALGLVHQLWRPVPGRIKDYIAMPKPNLYQSLHTTVMGESGAAVRDPDPHPGDGPDRGGGDRCPLEVQGGRSSAARRRRPVPAAPLPGRLAERGLRPAAVPLLLKVDLYPDEVYTFTPKGEVFAFPGGRPPSISPSRVHTDVGHRCVGARVNGKLVPLRTTLSSGDIVEILTAPNQTPSRDWLSFVATSRARHKIRHYIQAQEKDQAVELGRRLLERELKKYRKTVKKLEAEGKFSAELATWGFSRVEDLYAALGYGKLAPRNVLEKLIPAEELDRPETPRPETAVSRVVRKILPFGAPDITVVGHNDLLASLAKCCSPVPGEKIIGYITRGRGVSVHSDSCPNVRNLLYDPERQIDVAWAGEKGAFYAIELDVVTDDRPGLLADLTQAIAGEGSNIRRIEARSAEDRKGYVSVSLETSDLKHLEKIVSRLKAVSGVREVIRRYNVPKAGERD